MESALRQGKISKTYFLDYKWIAYYQEDLDSSNQRLDISKNDLGL